RRPGGRLRAGKREGEPGGEADGLAPPPDRPPLARVAPDVVARGKEVAGIDADADPLGPRRAREQRTELLERAANDLAGARRVLERDADLVARCPPGHLVEGGHG